MRGKYPERDAKTISKGEHEHERVKSAEGIVNLEEAEVISNRVILRTK